MKLTTPLKYFVVYILTTLFLSFWGPAIYNDYDKLGVFVYILFFLLCFIFGYKIGIRRKLHIRSSRYNIIPLVKFSISLSFILISLEFFQILLTEPYRFSLRNIGFNYLYSRELLDSSYSFSQLMRFITGFPRSISYILGFYFFNKLQRIYKIQFVLFVLLTILVYAVAHGTQKVFGDIIIYFSIVMLSKMNQIDKKTKKIIKIASLSLLFSFTAYFLMNQIQRYSSIEIDIYNISARSNGNIEFDLDHIIFKLFGFDIGFGLAILITSYLSAGYYGLSLCLQLPFAWTYGLGNSYPLSVFANRFLGFPNYYLDTYLNRMELLYGRGGLKSWNTIFPWLASDLTFIGALLIFIPIGTIYAISWKETIKYRNPVSILMFSTLTLALVFVPNNNQLLNGIDGFIGTVCIFIFWIGFHKRFNYII
jgi:hypothetical protein